MEGKYSTRPIKQGEAIDAESLRGLPVFPTNILEKLFFVRTQDWSSVAAQANTGGRIVVFDGDRTNAPALGPFRIEAVLGRPEASITVLRVEKTNLADLQRIWNPKVRLVIPGPRIENE